MKEFIKQCMADLESLTGIRQTYYLTIDTDGERKATVLIQGILEVCKQFSYISEADQQKIIREQMVKDQNYDALNSRTVWKWFNGVKDLYWELAHKPKFENAIPLEPLTPETEKMIRDWQASLLGLNSFHSKMDIFNYKMHGFHAEMDKIQSEDEQRLAGIPVKSKSSKYVPDENLVLVNQRRMKAARDRGLDKLDLRDLKPFEVEGMVIHCRNLEEAQEMYLEIYS